MRDPLGLTRDVVGTLLHPFPNVQLVAYCTMLTAFLFTAYVVVRNLRVGDGIADE